MLTIELGREESPTAFESDAFVGELVVRGEASGMGGLGEFAIMLLLEGVGTGPVREGVVHEMHRFFVFGFLFVGALRLFFELFGVVFLEFFEVVFVEFFVFVFVELFDFVFVELFEFVFVELFGCAVRKFGS